MKRIDITGKRFGRLVGIRPTKRRDGGNIIWECRCDCGNVTFVATSNLKVGGVVSCGCQRRENVTIHNKCGTSEYVSWLGIKQRCYNKKNHAYKYYGGKGIKICKLWRKSFVNFYNDMGKKPSSKLTLDRIDNNGNYYCWYNCRWATRQEQADNKGKYRKRIKRKAIKLNN